MLGICYHDCNDKMQASRFHIIDTAMMAVMSTTIRIDGRAAHEKFGRVEVGGGGCCCCSFGKKVIDHQKRTIIIPFSMVW